jgi:hypothetical protein
VQTIIRVINILLGPILTLVFAARFAGVHIAGKEAGDALGGAFAGLLMLAVELGLTQGPKHSAWLRRWLDPRAAFEGVWLQDVAGGTENALGIFSMSYEPETDSFELSGHAYSLSGARWAKWTATHMFIDRRQLRATYRWEGDVLGPVPASESDKSGLTVLELRRPPPLSLPMSGDGEVFHVGEARRIKFRLRRVTARLLRDAGLDFTLRELRLDARDEEQRLAAAFLRAHQSMPAHRSADAMAAVPDVGDSARLR